MSRRAGKGLDPSGGRGARELGMMKKHLVSILSVGAALCLFSACEERKGPMEKAGEKIDETTEEIVEENN